MVSGQTASACCVVLSVAGFATFGTWKIMCGRRSILIIRNVGSTSMPARRLGIRLYYILKVGLHLLPGRVSCSVRC